MKFVVASTLALFAQSASAHYIFNTLITASGNSQAAVRQPINNTPVSSVTSPDMKCNASPKAATATVSVPAGSMVGFSADNGIYHAGPASIYLGDMSGNSWFKIAEWGATFSPFTFTDVNQSKLTTTIPSATPSGDYLLRIEQIGLHVAGAPQFYISCAQITVTGGGKGNPAKVSIPGHIPASDPGITVNIYNPVPTSYKVPGPPVWK